MELFILEECLTYLVKVDSSPNSGFVCERCSACQPFNILCTNRTENAVLDDRATSIMIFLHKKNSKTSYIVLYNNVGSTINLRFKKILSCNINDI